MADPVFRERASFTPVDYIIFGLTVAISSGVGIYFAISGGRQKTTAEYLVGNRNLHVVPVALSLIVSFESSILMLGYPAEIYAHGTQFWMLHVGLPLTFLCIAQVVVPVIHPLGITSAYQYLELRYGSRAIRLLASCLAILYQTFYMGVVLFGPATALEAASVSPVTTPAFSLIPPSLFAVQPQYFLSPPLPFPSSLHLSLLSSLISGFPVGYSIVLISAASVFYTSLGGIKAVIWTDAIQFIIMLGGILAVIIMGSIYVGGFDKMWQLNSDGGRVKFLEYKNLCLGLRGSLRSFSALPKGYIGY
ncbi:sodium-dependent multivitamin transporter-like [Liolophura sinensis]|uniref:sodium-dependent multivitamin transporter-like n=1 Tax=Liolophura sinensis TaxID=3198878 RepID=UPI00315927DF